MSAPSWVASDETFTQQRDQLIVTAQTENAPGGKVFNRKRNYRKTLPILEDLGVTYPGCQRFFFSLGGYRIEWRRREDESRSRPALLALTLLAAGEREDLWQPG